MVWGVVLCFAKCVIINKKEKKLQVTSASISVSIRLIYNIYASHIFKHMYIDLVRCLKIYIEKHRSINRSRSSSEFTVAFWTVCIFVEMFLYLIA